MVPLSPHLRAPRPRDAAPVWRLASASRSLDVNSPYAYLLACREFAATCTVADVDGDVAGFVIGFRPPARPESVFVWQVAVADAHRKQGMGGSMLDHLVGRVPGARWLEATVTPGNGASDRLFRAFASRRGAPLREEPFAASEDFPPEAGPHEAETLYRIGPLDPDGPDRLHPPERKEHV